MMPDRAVPLDTDPPPEDGFTDDEIGGEPVPLDPEEAATGPVAGQIELPGWSDVIHLVPDSMVSKADQIKRKVDRARRIQDSPATPLSRSVSWVMTKIDDIQDACVTLSVVGRIAAIGIPALRPVAELFGKAADTFNLATLFKAATKLPTQTKRGLESRMSSSPGYYQGRVKGATTLAKALPNIAETLQILQTSDQLTGVGISLGPIMGAPLAAVADLFTADTTPTLMSWQQIAALPEDRRMQMAADEARRLEPALRTKTLAYGLATVVSVLNPVTLAVAATTEIVGRYINAVTSARPADLAAATRILDASPIVGGTDHTFTPNEHLLFALAHSLALATCADASGGMPVAALSGPLLDRILTASPPADPGTRLALEIIGVNPDAPCPLPLHGSPMRVSLRDAIAEWSETIPQKTTSWRNALRTKSQLAFAGYLHTEQARTPWKILDGPSVQVETGYSVQGRAANALMSMGIGLPEHFPDDRVWDLLTALGSQWFRNGTAHPRRDDALRGVSEWTATNIPRGPS